MWCKWSNRYFDRIENFAYGEINEQSFSNPHPWPLAISSLAAEYKFEQTVSGDMRRLDANITSLKCLLTHFAGNLGRFQYKYVV